MQIFFALQNETFNFKTVHADDVDLRLNKTLTKLHCDTAQPKIKKKKQNKTPRNGMQYTM